MPISRFLTVGDLKKLIDTLPDNAIIGTAVKGQWCGENLTAERWRLVQHRKTKRVGLIIGDESLNRTVDQNEEFHAAYTVLIGDHSFDMRLADPEFRNPKKKRNPIEEIFGG